MKAERRHELKTNTLARKLEGAPAFFQKYGSRILLGLILCVLAYFLVKRYIDSKDLKKLEAREYVGEATMALQRMGQKGGDPHELKEIEKSLVGALESDEPNIRAAAFVIRGDANLEAAGFTLPPEAKPDQKPDKTRDEYLANATSAYNQVLNAPLNSEHAFVTSARLGMAAVAENRRKFDKAAEYYQQIIDDPKSDKVYKELAQSKLKTLKTMSAPVYLSAETEIPNPHASRPEDKPLLPPRTDFPLLPEFSPQKPKPSPETPSTKPATPATRPAAVAPAVPSVTTQP